jgi:ankyrin repeat protein
VVQLLISWKADIAAKDAWGYNALHLVASNIDSHCLQLLVVKGSNLMSQALHWESHLHIATVNGREGNVLWLIDKAIPVDIPTIFRVTALITASHMGNYVYIHIYIVLVDFFF